MNIKKSRLSVGPGIWVTAAFIGPGTVTVCMLSGIQYQFGLLWVMFIAVVATIILQEMAARLGLVTQKGLGESIVTSVSNTFLRKTTQFLIVTGILLGNAAFEAGNITGTRLGVDILTGNQVHPSFIIWSVVAVTALLLWFGTYRRVSMFFTILVALMSIAFLIASIVTKPVFTDVLNGLFFPSIPTDSLLVMVGLIGTTVVPYNLFMHAALIRDKWQYPDSLTSVRKDIYFSIGLGGLISVCIIITGASLIGTDSTNVEGFASSLNPVFGEFGTFMFGFGFFAAGFTSSVTAPLAAALVARELFGWPDDSSEWKYKAVWMGTLLSGGLISSMGYKPIEIISIAQFANGLLLPFIACFLLWVVNRKDIMGNFSNNTYQNMLGILVIGVTILLGFKGIVAAIQNIISLI